MANRWARGPVCASKQKYVVVTERKENRVSACVGLFAASVCLIFAVITERRERLFVGRSFLLTQLCGELTEEDGL